MHALEDGLLADDVAVGEILVQRPEIDGALDAPERQQGLDLRGEQDALSVPVIEEGLLAETVAHEDKPGRPAVPKRAREHPVEPREGLEPFVDVEGKEHFRVRPRAEHVAPLLELGFQLRVVVDLAVEADAHLAVRRLHRLLAARQVDDAQAPVRECHGAALVESLLVRTPMAQDFGHPMQALAGRSTSRIELEDAGDTTHGSAQTFLANVRHPPSSWSSKTSPARNSASYGGNAPRSSGTRPPQRHTTRRCPARHRPVSASRWSGSRIPARAATAARSPRAAARATRTSRSCRGRAGAARCREAASATPRHR